MSIKVNIEPSDSKDEAQEPSVPSVKLEIRKTLDGKIMILDHMFFDIIVDTQAKRIVTFPKEQVNDETYHYQSDYFKYLTTEGVVKPESVISGNVYGSLQADYPDSSDESISPAQVVLLSTTKYLNENKPSFEMLQYIDNEMEDHLIDPTPEESTELGDVKQAPTKGTIGPDQVRKYLSGYGRY